MNENKLKGIFLRVKSDGKIYKSDIGNLEIEMGDKVLFENDQGQEVGTVVSESVVKEEREQDREEITSVVLIRKLTQKDLEKIKELKEEAKETLSKCLEKIKSHNLEMQLLDADLSYDGKKLTFYFTAPGRVDFRSLVPDLASTFKKLIRLQQVSCRDKAKFFGGVGRCGQNFCCKRFLQGDLESVSTEMANEQGLGQMGPNRVIGCCGKPMCCLKYEIDFYKKAKVKMPAVGTKYKTPEGEGVVIEQVYLKNSIKVNVEGKIVEVNC